MVKGKGALICALFLHHIKRVSIQDAHQPGTERIALLETRESAPCQEKRPLRDLLCQCALVAEAQGGCHCNSMMGLPEMPERLLVSVSRAFDELRLASLHAFSPSVAIVHPSECKRFRTSLFWRWLIAISAKLC